MRIAHAASELFPYLKTGGLADMVAALSGALVDRGHEIALFLPGYRTVLEGAPAKGVRRSSVTRASGSGIEGLNRSMNRFYALGSLLGRGFGAARIDR